MSAEDGENDLPISHGDGDDGDGGPEDGDGGESLADRLGVRFEPHIAHAILEDISAQLASLHGRGVAHGALEPTRVLLHVEPGQLVPRVEVVEAGGTPMNLMYSAPEVARGSFDARSDVYSLGALAHHMIVGQPPDRRGAPPSDLWPGIPGTTESLLVRMLSTDPADRPSLAEARLGFASFDAPPWWRSWKTALAGAVTVVAVVLAVLIARPAARTPDAEPVAEPPPPAPAPPPVAAAPAPTPAPVTAAPPTPVPVVPPPTSIPDARPAAVAIPDARPVVVAIPDARPAVVVIPDARPPAKPRVVEKPVPPPPVVEKPPVTQLPPRPKPAVAAPPPIAKPKPKPPAKKPKADDDLMDPFGKK